MAELARVGWWGVVEVWVIEAKEGVDSGHGAGNQGNQGASGQGGATLLLVARATWKLLLSLERWTVQIWTLLLC